jgi:hypothetical protein
MRESLSTRGHDAFVQNMSTTDENPKRERETEEERGSDRSSLCS